MRKGSRRCCVTGCRLMATGAVLHVPRWDGRAYGSNACQGHLEEAVEAILKRHYRLEDMLLMAAKGELPK
jgi:hypothetical protein